MTIFAVMALDPTAVLAMANRVPVNFPENHYKAANNIWFVAGSGTAKEITDKLGVTPPDSPTTVSAVVVVSMSGYYGLAPVPIWEFLAAKMAAK